MKEHRELQTLIDQLEAHIRKQAEQIDSLLKTVEALVVACEQVAADEREACAKLCDDWFAGTAGRAIRERGKPDSSFKNYMGDNWAGIV